MCCFGHPRCCSNTREPAKFMPSSKNSGWTVSGWATSKVFGRSPIRAAAHGRPSDYRHRKPPAPAAGWNPNTAGRGLIIQAAKHEFYLTGFGWRLHLRPKIEPDKNRFCAVPGRLALRNAGSPLFYLSTRGYFDDDGKFVTVIRVTADKSTGVCGRRRYRGCTRKTL